MRIIIVGGGVVGYSLAEHLEEEHHDISLIEKDPVSCRDISERLDIRIVCGSGTSPRSLEEAGIENASMIIAVTPFDEVNILVCAIARQYDVETRIARIRSNEFRGGNSSIDISKIGVTLVIDPESVVVDAITQFIETPGATDATNFQSGHILMRGYHVVSGMPIVGKPISETRAEKREHPMLFIAAIRDGRGIIPDGDYVVEPGDDIFGIFPRTSLDAYLSFFNKTRKDTGNVIITGASLTAVLLAEQLSRMVDKVILIDPSAEHARHTADILNNVEIVNGDGTDSAILHEVYVRNTHFFIAVDNETDYNILSCLLAKAEGARQVIAISGDSQHIQLFKSIGVDNVIVPRLTIAREILEAINKAQIGRIARIRDLDIEAIRITAAENSPITGKPLQHVRSKIQKGSIVGTVLRNDEMIIPDGNTVIEPGDQMIVITYTSHVPRLRKLFKAR